MLARVLLGHRGSIVEVVHLRAGQVFTIGDHPRASWIVSHPSLPALERVELVRVTTRGIELARPGGGQSAWEPLAKGDAVRLEFGEAWVHVSASEPERLRLGRRGPDWGMLASTAVVGALAAAFALLAHAAPEIAPFEDQAAEPAYVRLLKPTTLDVDPEQLETKRKPPPPPIPECDEKEAGGAPKAKRSEGAGSRKRVATRAPAPKQMPNQPRRPIDEPTTDANAGILGVMASQSQHFLASPYAGAFSIGSDDGDVWGGLATDANSGVGSGYGYGIGGMGLVGVGRGGGGSGMGTIGLGNTGLIGKGGGCSVCRRKHKPKPLVALGRMQLSGPHDPGVIRRVSKSRLRPLQACYDTALNRDAKLRGEVRLKYVLRVDGSVSTVLVEHAQDRKLGECMAKAYKIGRFPAAGGAGSIVQQTITLGANQ